MTERSAKALGLQASLDAEVKQLTAGIASLQKQGSNSNATPSSPKTFLGRLLAELLRVSDPCAADHRPQGQCWTLAQQAEARSAFARAHGWLACAARKAHQMPLSACNL